MDELLMNIIHIQKTLITQQNDVIKSLKEVLFESRVRFVGKGEVFQESFYTGDTNGS